MPHYGVLREYKLEEVDDVRGADVYGVNDEKLGTIDDVIFDHSSGEIRYVVLKTGGMLSSKRIMVPANRISPYGNHDDKFYAELDKERLQMLPEFNDETLNKESDWTDFEKNYEERWNDGDVMYNKDTGRIITPSADEQLQGAGRQMGQQAKERLNRDFTPQRMGKEDDLLGVASGTGKTTLHPQKPSIAGRESLGQEDRMNVSQENVTRESSQREGSWRGNADREILDRENLGRENALGANLGENQPTREIEGTMGTEFQVSNTAGTTPTEAIREPGVYRLDPMPGTRQNVGADQANVNEGANVNERTQGNYGRRWMQFQQRLRERRDKVVSGCNLCGTQDKAA